MTLESLIDSDYVSAVDSRLSSHAAYVNYQMREAQRALPFFARFLPTREASVLEIGTGRGGKGMAYACAGMRVMAVDVDAPLIGLAAGTARERGVPIQFLAADGGHLPFPDSHFDAVLLDSVLEHASDPFSILLECKRVLKPDGVAFVVFPPYFGPLSGHIDDYVMIPWFHLLPPPIVKRYLLSRPPLPGFLSPRDAYGVYASLNRLTIWHFRRWTRRVGLHIDYFRVRPFLTHPGTRLAIGFVTAFRRPRHGQKIGAVLGRVLKEFDLGTSVLFVLLCAVAPLAFVPILQEIVAGGCKCVLRKTA